MTDWMDGYQGCTGQHDFALGRGAGAAIFLGARVGRASLRDIPYTVMTTRAPTVLIKSVFLTQIEYFLRNYRRNSLEFPIFLSITSHSV